VASGKHFIDEVPDAQMPATIGPNPITKRVEESCKGSDDRWKCWFNLLLDNSLGQQDHVLVKVPW